MARIGLVAGYGEIPVLFSKTAKKMGDTVIAFGVKGITNGELEGYVDKMHWLDWGSLKKGLLLLATERIERIVMLGNIKKDAFFKKDDNEKLDDEAKKLLKEIGDKKDYAILNGVEKLLNSMGVKVIDPLSYLKDLVPSKGLLTRRGPSSDEWQDINYGKEVARELARFDIGQTVAVKDKTVIALEGVEGTDETIKRAGGLVDGGFVVVKVARPNQDMRFDIPLVGLDTTKSLIEAKGNVLALEEKKMFLMDRDEAVRLADENNISIVVI